MKKHFILIFFLFALAMSAQIHEIGAFLGGSNYIGEVGLTSFIAPKEPAIGILYKWNKSPRHSYRFSFTQSKIVANDRDSKEPSRNARGYLFENNIKELSLGLEFNFFNFDLHDTRKKITPYFYLGLTYLFFNESYLNSSLSIVSNNNKISNSFGIPMHIGTKSNINPHTVLAIEVGARYTFTDNLDGSNPKDDTKMKFGNINNNDWYVFSGLTLTYTFGSKPCYCAE